MGIWNWYKEDVDMTPVKKEAERELEFHEINFRLKITDINRNEHLESLTFTYYDGWGNTPRECLEDEIRALRAFVGGIKLHSEAIYNPATVIKVEIL